MFTAGYSAKVTDKHKQNILSALGNLVEGDLFTVHAWEGEVGGEGIDHQEGSGMVIRRSVPVYRMFFHAHVNR
jgi:hypothetical protein